MGGAACLSQPPRCGLAQPVGAAAVHAGSPALVAEPIPEAGRAVRLALIGNQEGEITGGRLGDDLCQRRVHGEPQRASGLLLADGQHAFDYCNVANYWMRGSDNPYQPRVLYLMANFVNDAARSNKLHTSVREHECAGVNVNGRSPETWLRELDEAILAYDVPRTTALATAYLDSGADRTAYQQTIALAACKFQDDPHNQKITHSTFEEYGENTTHLRDRLLLATARLLAGWPKMPGERDCYARFMKEWINN